MIVRVLAIVLIACVASAVVGEEKEEKVELSPHASALMLVFESQRDEIRKVDREKWWHDVKEREWVVKRPFYPGVIDSTHTFTVTYRIDGKVAQSWMVDTRKKTVDIVKAPAAKKKE